MLVEARAVPYMTQYLGAYDPGSYPSECRDVIEALNCTALRILQQVEKMDLRELGLYIKFSYDFNLVI